MKKVLGDKQNEPLTYLTSIIAPIRALPNDKLLAELTEFICTGAGSISKLIFCHDKTWTMLASVDGRNYITLVALKITVGQRSLTFVTEFVTAEKLR